VSLYDACVYAHNKIEATISVYKRCDCALEDILLEEVYFSWLIVFGVWSDIDIIFVITRHIQFFILSKVHCCCENRSPEKRVLFCLLFWLCTI